MSGALYEEVHRHRMDRAVSAVFRVEITGTLSETVERQSLTILSACPVLDGHAR